MTRRCDICGAKVDPSMRRCDECIEETQRQRELQREANDDLLPMPRGTDFEDEVRQ